MNMNITRLVGPDSKTFAIIVIYQPNLLRLTEMLNRLVFQCQIVLVDNAEISERCTELDAICAELGINKLEMDGNCGIAAAQNQGFKWVMERGATHILLLDDDSLIPPNMVKSLLAIESKLKAEGRRPAAIGARAMDDQGRNLSTVAMSSSVLSRCFNLTSSGSLIPVEALVDIGLMDESLFIDCVDYDWGWRAIEKGYDLYISNQVVMQHRLGQGRVDLLGLKVGIPSPIRHYYQYRNIPRMLTRSYVPFRWKIKQTISLVLKPFFILAFMNSRRTRYEYIGRGIKDFFDGKCGKYGS